MAKMFLCFNVNLNMKAQKPACFHVNFPFSAYFTPLHQNDKGSINLTDCRVFALHHNGKGSIKVRCIHWLRTVPCSILQVPARQDEKCEHLS